MNQKAKMTSGEIAKKTGVSQKAIRLYDEKGLLKPTEYSEGNYRLYDKEALLVLEKIIALKQVGFSLEEIRENLIREGDMEVQEVLANQIHIMEEKKYQLEKAITCIKKAMERSASEPDWDSIADIMRVIQMDQRADERHYHALQHEADKEDWYVKIFKSLKLQEKEKVLDLGCGYAKLWRNNWSGIPYGISIDAVDVHGSWADDFETFVGKNESRLPENVSIKMNWLDVEEPETWEKLGENKPYDRIIAHYLFSFLQDEEAFIRHSSEMLSPEGVFCCNKVSVTNAYEFWKSFFLQDGLDDKFVLAQIRQKEEEVKDFESLLAKYFSRIEKIQIPSRMKYGSADELFDQALNRFPEQKKYLTQCEGKIKTYFEKMLKDSGEVLIETSTTFWHCYH